MFDLNPFFLLSISIVHRWNARHSYEWAGQASNYTGA